MKKNIKMINRKMPPKFYVVFFFLINKLQYYCCKIVMDMTIEFVCFPYGYLKKMFLEIRCIVILFSDERSCFHFL